MSISYGEKLRLIRKSEGFTQAQMRDLTGISLGAIKNYETQGVDVGLSIIERLLSVDQLRKYTLWLMTGETAPEAGQIAPAGAEELTQMDDKIPDANKQSG